MFQRTKLPNGPRVISARLPGARSLSVAAYVLAGSRQEPLPLWGAAHFMEHITFKGTSRFPNTRSVSEAVEAYGGTSNAATDRESTVYWTKLPVREAERAFNLLAELIVRPLLRDSDIEHEREIIVDEIRSYREDPAQYVFNLFDVAFFGDSPMGREIAGDEDSVRGIPAEQIRTFWNSSYQPANTVVSVAGDISHDSAVELVANAFGTGNGAMAGFSPAPAVPVQRVTVEQRQCGQAHVCLGFPGLPRDHPDQWTLELLNAVLGDGSSSRLFLQLREEAALAYDVHSFPSDYADCGLLQVYAGVDPADLPAAIGAILAELARLRDEPVPQAELDKARAYTAGRLELRLEESRPLASWLGIQEALHERVLTLDEVLAKLHEVTPGDLAGLAGRLIRDDALCLAVITPPGTAKGVEHALRLP